MFARITNSLRRNLSSAHRFVRSLRMSTWGLLAYVLAVLIPPFTPSLSHPEYFSPFAVGTYLLGIFVGLVVVIGLMALDYFADQALPYAPQRDNNSPAPQPANPNYQEASMANAFAVMYVAQTLCLGATVRGCLAAENKRISA